MNQIPGGRPSIQWLVKTESEKQLGPYSTEAILKMISEGAFSGLEQIKRYPDGRWNAISRQADFYDKLLEVLEEVKVTTRAQEKFEAETVIAKIPERKSFSVEEFEKTKALPMTEERERQNVRSFARGEIKPGSAKGSQSQTIEMSRLDHLQKKENIKSAKLPLFLVAGAVIFGAIAYLWPEEQVLSGGKPNLLVPKESSSASLSGPEVKSAIQKAVATWVKDTYESASEAQSKLVMVIEGAPQNVEARGVLCLVYRDLWPYVKQDSKDLDAISSLTKGTRSLDPTGISGVYCEVTKLMTLGKYKEARGVVEYALNQPAMSTAPVLYALKAELLFEERDIKTAVLYMDKARQLWPDWVKPQINLGIYHARLEQNAEASQNLQNVLQMNPKHKLAQVEYGVLLYKGYRQAEEAVRLLSAAVTSLGKFSRMDEARAHFFLALIYAERKDLVKAREYSEKAYALNPGDSHVKDLLVRLGGSVEINGKVAKNNELVFLGDQFFRTGNCLAAQAEYKAAFELDPTNAVAAMKAGKCLWQLSQGTEAINWLNKAISADKKLTPAYVLQADYYSQRYNYFSATQILNKAAQLFPNNYEILRGYGLVDFRRNNIKDAIGYLQRANKIYENDVDTLVLLAKSHAANRDFSSAQKYAVRAIELDATNNEAQIVYAQILTQFQGLDTGLVYIRDLINKFSYTIEFRLAMAELYKEQERYSQAQKIYEQLVDADPKNKKAHLGLGQSYQAQALFEKALKEYLSATVIDPSDAEGLFRAGLLYSEIGKQSEAITQYKRALSINSLFPRLNYHIGRAYFQNNQYDAAVASAMEERKLNPGLADSYILAAEVYSATKQFQKCAGEYQQAIKLRPQGAELYVKVARCYRQAGSPDIAESMINIAASQESGLPEIYREQGAIYEIKGDSRAAVAAYNKYLTLSPNAPDRVEIETLIRSIGNGK